MIKTLNDVLQGILYEDDKQIDHLSIMKIKWNGEEEFIFINIKHSNLNNHQDVLLDRMLHDWAQKHSTWKIS